MAVVLLSSSIRMRVPAGLVLAAAALESEHNTCWAMSYELLALGGKLFRNGSDP
jgi:hypothetical protein